MLTFSEGKILEMLMTAIFVLYGRKKWIRSNVTESAEKCNRKERSVEKHFI